MTIHSLLGNLVSIVQSDSSCKNVEIIEIKQFSVEQYFFKIRATLLKEHFFQIRIYFNHGHIDYAYQLFTDEPILRWDNKEEFKTLETFPHHFHNEKGKINTSPLVGDPITDLKYVLIQINNFIK